MSPIAKIESPDDPELARLGERLNELAPQLEAANAWPAEQLDLCAQAGVFEWFLPQVHGGQDWSEADIIRGYLQLAAGCLTTTFIITQRMGACRRLAGCDNVGLQQEWLPPLLSGEKISTVGISHLTTSRRHLKKPVLAAEEQADGFLLSGYSPWVTGSTQADVVVIGATLPDGRQLLAALPTDMPGVSTPPAAKLVGLSASQTGPIQCDNVLLPHALLMAGPVEDVMSQGQGANTGGLQTSTLAVGLASAAIRFLEGETEKRDELSPAAVALRRDQAALESDLLAAAAGEPACSSEELRTRANSLSLRASQAALTAAKGAGYLIGHPAGRWCREALFFLVWSCPQPVLAANLCELAGIQE
ncbi:acyl-CoA dehydrogenase family protein [Lignipirellula cremea]|uniref:Glutaryl-CoA dehydrogenase n=1 Tax=Lignipirellula cremea TaxID=2528010 RepID=A0A518DU36_9BACT|nr:acyl-CoA dehydrogenase family protein [Lignipirellula cremea]QDU95339.1 Glutaryl-CoA dehydrogenase [Lignipirellula cremea]